MRDFVMCCTNYSTCMMYEGIKVSWMKVLKCEVYVVIMMHENL